MQEHRPRRARRFTKETGGGEIAILLPVALLGIGLTAFYYRFREDFSDLATATDSKKSDGFWSIIALVYAVVIGVLYVAFRQRFDSSRSLCRIEV